MTNYQCIECGNKVRMLYREYKAGVIKISHCDSCNAVADKYIEYDPVIIFLDALLLRRQAYRHLLINTQFDSHWKLAVLLWICDAFIKLVVQRAELASRYVDTEPFNYTYIGLELYLNFIIAVAELLVLLTVVLAVYGLRSYWRHRRLNAFRTQPFTKAVIVASLWHMLAIPALLWGQVYSSIYLWLSQAFVYISTFQALKVVTQDDSNSSLWAAVSVAIGFTAQMLVPGVISEWFQTEFLDT
ncbi:hypothetical protein BsWGS_15375 [Bradybaena similaris]